MTGLSAKGGFLYVSSVNQNACYRYTMPNILSRTFYRSYSGYYQTKDIAIDADNHIWVAANHPTHSARLYNAGSTMIDYIPTSLVPHATGMAMDPDGFLWMADPVNNKIYKIDLQVGIQEGNSSEMPDFTVRAGSNPFVGSVTLHIEGAGMASIEVLDIFGRVVASGTAAGSWLWDGQVNGNPAPSGYYLALIRSETGSVQSLNLIKI